LGIALLTEIKAMLKELLPIVDKPLIQYATEEAILAGINILIFVTRRKKRAINDYFDNNQKLDLALRARGKSDQENMVKNIFPNGDKCILVR
jgi:UTP--glucose-1-phosphate uridylyltransferase